MAWHDMGGVPHRMNPPSGQRISRRGSGDVRERDEMRIEGAGEASLAHLGSHSRFEAEGC